MTAHIFVLIVAWLMVQDGKIVPGGDMATFDSQAKCELVRAKFQQSLKDDQLPEGVIGASVSPCVRIDISPPSRGA